MIKSKFTFIFNHFYIYTILVVLTILTMHFYILSILLIIYIYKIRKKYALIISILIVLFYATLATYFETHEKSINKEVRIIEVDHFDTYQRYTIVYKLKRYHFNHRDYFEVGSKVHIQGLIENYRKQTIPGGFNAHNYQKGQGVYGIIRLDSIKLKHPPNHLNYPLKQSPFTSLFKDQSIIDVSWMSHLFKLSSIHLACMIMILFKVMYYLDIEDRFKFGIISLMMFIFYTIGYSIIIFRMMIKYGLKYVSEMFHLEIDSFNIECMTLVCILLFKPYIIYNQTFLVVYSMVMLMHLKNDHITALNYMAPPLLMIPFLLFWYKDLSLLSLIIMPMIAALIKYIFMPTLLVSTILPFIDILDIFEGLVMRFEQFISGYDVRIYLTHLNGFMWLIYFIILIFICASKNHKTFYRRIFMCLTCIVISFINTFKPVEDHVIFLDVGQGDSAVIFKNNQVIVVDAYQNVSDYLKYRYVYTIDYLIISHPDEDHMKEASTLIENFEVLHLVINGYDTYDLRHPNMLSIQSAPVNIGGDLGIHILGPQKNYYHKNDNSLVFQIDIAGLRYLFTGDIGVGPEKDYIQSYQDQLKSDVLKVPHHGSSTSSSEPFISYIRPNIVVISVGHRNMYRLPNTSVLKMYEQLNAYVHLTKDAGSLKINGQTLQNFPP